MTRMLPAIYHKECPYCKTWINLDQLVNDPQIRLIGMTFADDSIECVYYFFQHDLADCGTSFVVKAEFFVDYIGEPLPTHKLTNRDCCEQHCVNLSDLAACHQECYFDPFRRFMHQMIAAKGGKASQLKPVTGALRPKSFAV